MNGESVPPVLKGEIVEEGETPNLAILKSTNGGSRGQRVTDEYALSTAREDSPVYDYLIGLNGRSQHSQFSALKAGLSCLLHGKPVRKLTKAERTEITLAVFEFPWNSITRRQYKGIAVRMRSGYAGNTASRNMSGVKQVMEMCTLPEYVGTRWHMSYEDFAAATVKKGLPKFKLNKGMAGRALESEELGQLFGACEVREDGTKEYASTEARDKAVLGLLFLRAMRVQEVVTLQIGDYSRRSGELNITESKTETGIRRIVLSGPSKKYMDDWLDFRFKADSRRDDGPIFYRVNKTGTILTSRKAYVPTCQGPRIKGIPQGCGFDYLEAQRNLYAEKRYSRSIVKCPDCGTPREYELEYRPITTQAIRSMLLKRARLADIPRLQTHDGRRTTLTMHLENNNLPAAQELAGHASKDQTLSYWRFSKKKHQEAADALDRQQSEALGMEPPADNGDK